jgi:PPE-repeat protein
MTFELLPPEINSARMYTGAGSAPLFAAASGWDGLAEDLHASSSSFDSVISTMGNGVWTGPAAAAMAGVATGYVGWLTASAALAEGVAVQARAAATAFETARTATVHPAAVEGNRIELATLVATNFLGVNIPAIAMTEFEYIEMWAQDVAAMVAYYAGALTAASQLIPFAALPIDFAGMATQVAGAAELAGTALVAAAPQAVSAVQAIPLEAVSQGVQLISTPLGMAMSPLSSAMGGGASAPVTADLAAADLSEMGGAGLPGAMKPSGGAGLGASAGLGQGRMIGALSVPQSWAGSLPAGLGSSALAGLGRVGLTSAAAGAEAAAAGAGGGMPMMPMPAGGGAAGGMPNAMMGRGSGGSQVVQSRPSVIPRAGV